MKKSKIKNIIIAAIVFAAIGSLLLTVISRVKRPKKARVAIVLDDWGYNKNNLNLLFEIKIPLTLAVLPDLPYSEEIATTAGKKNYEVILHLPLEPHNCTNVEKGTIYTWMDKEKIVELFNGAFQDMPNAVGVSSHMGSRATEDARVMGAIFDRMKEGRLYFLDSCSSENSVCKDLSRKYKLKFAQRNVFLDNENDQKKITQQLYELIEKAKRKGFAIGIGHDRRSTLLAIKKFIPELEKSKVEVVKLSELVK